MAKKMDEIEGGVLSRFPPGSLTLTLTRAAIRMQHSTSWRIEKENPVEDLVVALEGCGHYMVDGAPLTLAAGEAMLLPRGTRFVGWNEGPGTYLGVAQHFTLSAHGAHDLIGQMELRRKVRLSRWDVLEPMIRHYRQSAPPASITLAQHHLFMVMLLSFIDDAFVGWRQDAAAPVEAGEGIDLAVMKAASRIAAAPLEDDIGARVVEDAPYNPDYFHRAFRERIGRTPRQYHEFCRIERAAHLLESGLAVGAAAAEVGYADPYYFSRCFKRVMGVSPRAHLRRVALSRDGQLMGLDEPEQEAALTGSRRDGG
ncbi:DNA-binding domain-containing protein, AraC-type (plasmid) [Salipiger profundus]|jgi:AraC-like DNA-binding protein|uniref:DNA-binding domain-containing protein, AraC-type n=2 Tax=Roseobacteraceae TaxID=2854170 RepID=A0A1U7DCE5_9RHOB|nr:AraC family transcriptional regulator [Salipiger profundus]APX25834.1 DNA-binding domain-containing protein, AraC-type [Salipiger profundus]SFC86850.1 AraC-type DNA-binding protein [Salipiger profundus]